MKPLKKIDIREHVRGQIKRRDYFSAAHVLSMGYEDLIPWFIGELEAKFRKKPNIGTAEWIINFSKDERMIDIAIGYMLENIRKKQGDYRFKVSNAESCYMVIGATGFEQIDKLLDNLTETDVLVCLYGYLKNNLAFDENLGQKTRRNMKYALEKTMKTLERIVLESRAFSVLKIVLSDSEIKELRIMAGMRIIAMNEVHSMERLRVEDIRDIEIAKEMITICNLDLAESLVMRFDDEELTRMALERGDALKLVMHLALNEKNERLGIVGVERLEDSEAILDVVLRSKIMAVRVRAFERIKHDVGNLERVMKGWNDRDPIKVAAMNEYSKRIEDSSNLDMLTLTYLVMDENVKKRVERKVEELGMEIPEKYRVKYD